MGKIKGWKKVSKNMYSNKHSGTSIKIRKLDNTGKNAGKWSMLLNFGKGEKILKNEIQARKFTVKYMRSHPNG